MPDGVPSTFRLDPATGLIAPGAYIGAFNGAYQMGNSLTIPAFNFQPMAVGATAGWGFQGFEVSPVTVQQVAGFPFTPWFRPIFPGNFTVDGAGSGFDVGGGALSRFIAWLYEWTAPNVGGGALSSWTFSLAPPVNTHHAFIGPQGPGIQALRNDKWYSWYIQTASVNNRIDFNDVQQINLTEIFI